MQNALIYALRFFPHAAKMTGDPVQHRNHSGRLPDD